MFRSCGMFCFPCWLHCSAVLLLDFLLFQQTVVGLQFLGLKIFTKLSLNMFNLSLQMKDLSRSKRTLSCKLCFAATLHTLQDFLLHEIGKRKQYRSGNEPQWSWNGEDMFNKQRVPNGSLPPRRLQGKLIWWSREMDNVRCKFQMFKVLN